VRLNDLSIFKKPEWISSTEAGCAVGKNYNEMKETLHVDQLEKLN